MIGIRGLTRSLCNNENIGLRTAGDEAVRFVELLAKAGHDRPVCHLRLVAAALLRSTVFGRTFAPSAITPPLPYTPVSRSSECNSPSTRSRVFSPDWPGSSPPPAPRPAIRTTDRCRAGCHRRGRHGRHIARGRARQHRRHGHRRANHLHPREHPGFAECGRQYAVDAREPASSSSPSSFNNAAPPNKSANPHL